MQRTANIPTTSTSCVSLHRPPCTWDAIFPDIISFDGKPRTLGAAAAEVASQAPDDLHPSDPSGLILLVLISTRNSTHFAPLHETEHDAVIVGDSIIWHVRATLAEGKVHTHCFPGARCFCADTHDPEGRRERCSCCDSRGG